jgi:hypothetical protein
MVIATFTTCLNGLTLASTSRTTPWRAENVALCAVLNRPSSITERDFLLNTHLFASKNQVTAFQDAGEAYPMFWNAI